MPFVPTCAILALVSNGNDDEIAFRDMVKALHCPGCELEFTDQAVEWGWAWCEGRRDLMHEDGRDERDGPFKLKCELCGHRSWLNYFSKSVTSAEKPKQPPKVKRIRQR